MSGNYGWGGRDRGNDPAPRDDGFTRAQKPYSTQINPQDFAKAKSRMASPLSMHQSAMNAPASTPAPMMSQVGVSSPALNVPLNLTQKFEAQRPNVIILAMDRTGSMGEWRAEIFKRLPLLFKEAEKYLGAETLEVLFMGFGDIPMGDTVEAAPFGSGPELDTYLLALDKKELGGGNMIESSEIPAYFASTQVDLSKTKNVFYFTITDEGFYDLVEPHVTSQVGLKTHPRMATTAVFKNLKVKANVFTILANTNTLNDRIQSMWGQAVGSENVVVLEDHRRVVDVLLGIVARCVGRADQFSQHLQARQGGTQFGAVNIQTVHQALSRVGGAPQVAPQAHTKSLLALGGMTPQVAGPSAVVKEHDLVVPGGTKSLLDP